MTYKKKLIEVALPLEAINKAAGKEKSIRHGHPSTLHLWWARRPLAAARAVIFAQMVDDPSAHPDLFPTEFSQKKERGRLFKIIEDLVQWENTTNEEVLQRARDAIWESWRRACAENVDHANAKELFNRNVLPAFHDPFAGGGALPLEAQRLGLRSNASDLNPVAILINKAMIEIPPCFAGQPPVNPDYRAQINLSGRVWLRAHGLAEDVRYYGKWLRDQAERRIGALYPKVKVTEEMAKDRPDLQKYIGRNLTVIAWIWARTVKSPNPAFTNIDVPLASTFMLSTKASKEAYIEPVIETNNYRFTVRVGKPKNVAAAKNGTKLSRGANFKCLMSDAPIAPEYIKAEGIAGRMGTRLMAIVAEGDRGRIYLEPTREHELAAENAIPAWKPEVTISGSTQYLGVKPYGMDRFDQLYTARQLVALTTFSDLVTEAQEQIKLDAIEAGMPDDGRPLAKSGYGATAYAEAIAVYLGLGVSKIADSGNSLVSWKASMDQPIHLFTRQAIPMMWDFAEPCVFSGAMGDPLVTLKNIARVIDQLPANGTGVVQQQDAQTQTLSSGKVISTDPPYYDNVPYADLSDFFYVWLRKALRPIYPDLFATMAVPKAEELVAFAYRHSGKSGAERFFLDGMTQAMHQLAEHAHPAFPVTIYYAFKQSEHSEEGTTNTGWDTFLAAVVEAGFAISGTWPMRTELSNRLRGSESNALASSIVLVCRPRSSNAPDATRREFVAALKDELPTALDSLQAGNIAPVDLAQAAIGPGMAVFTRFAKVLDADGKVIPVRQALALINQVLDEVLAEQEADFDADTRWALAWFEQLGFDEGDFGVANVLAQAKVTAVDGLVDAGIIVAGKGKVRIMRPTELPSDWDPKTDSRLTIWEIVHHLVRVLEESGEWAAAQIVAKLGSQSDTARELCYRLYALCERKKRANEAMAYNALVQSWPEIVRLSREAPKVSATQTDDLFNQE